MNSESYIYVLKLSETSFFIGRLHFSKNKTLKAHLINNRYEIIHKEIYINIKNKELIEKELILLNKAIKKYGLKNIRSSSFYRISANTSFEQYQKIKSEYKFLDEYKLSDFNNSNFNEKLISKLVPDYRKRSRKRGVDSLQNKIRDAIYIYRLKLENNKYYVGYTVDINKRFKEHCSGLGSVWTNEHKPKHIMNVFEIKILNIKEAEKYENYITALTILDYGFENVRGGKFTQSAVINEKLMDKYSMKSIDPSLLVEIFNF